MVGDSGFTVIPPSLPRNALVVFLFFMIYVFLSCFRGTPPAACPGGEGKLQNSIDASRRVEGSGGIGPPALCCKRTSRYGKTCALRIHGSPVFLQPYFASCYGFIPSRDRWRDRVPSGSPLLAFLPHLHFHPCCRSDTGVPGHFAPDSLSSHTCAQGGRS